MVMVDISPKALRFARLAAEEQPDFAADPHVAVLKREEELFIASLKTSTESRPKYVEISKETAYFCLKAISSFVESKNQVFSDQWDGNDFEFMKSVANNMQKRLGLINVIPS